MVTGTALTYLLEALQSHSKLSPGPGDKIYESQLAGTNSHDNDLVISPTKDKKLDNICASGEDEVIALIPSICFILEQTLELITDGELMEVISKSIRLCKKMLNEGDRKRYKRSKVQTAAIPVRHNNAPRGRRAGQGCLACWPLCYVPGTFRHGLMAPTVATRDRRRNAG